MAKADIVAAGIAALAQAEQDAFGAAVDAAYAEQKASDGTVTTPSDQATIDALTAQVAALTAQDAADVKAGQDALAAVQAQVTDLQSKLDTAVAADVADKALVQNFSGAVSSLQTALDALKAAIPAAPAP